MSKVIFVLVALLLGTTGDIIAQQAADTLFLPEIINPAYRLDEGPIVLIDEGHFNAHVVEGSDRAFAKFLRKDGYQVRRHQSQFTRESLDVGDILVIPMPLSERNRIRGDSTHWFNMDSTDFSLPNPSAFTPEEIEVVQNWVRDGGRLLVVADHMPCSGAVTELALVFNLSFSNGHARGQHNGVFRRENGYLANHPITNGRNEFERIDSVKTFGGSAFTSFGNVEPILIFPPSSISIEPTEFRVITDDTPRISIGGWFQGAALCHGQGRVVFFGEAGMFFAHLKSQAMYRQGTTFLDSKLADQNPQFLLNVFHWLSEIL